MNDTNAAHTLAERTKIVPTPSELHAAFYAELASTGRLRVQQCRSCGQRHHPPRYRCAGCRGQDLAWADAALRGRLVSWTVTHRPIDPGWAGELPSVTAMVELADGIRVIGAFTGPDGATLRIDQPVTVSVEPVTDGFARVWFSPAADGPAVNGFDGDEPDV